MVEGNCQKQSGHGDFNRQQGGYGMGILGHFRLCCDRQKSMSIFNYSDPRIQVNRHSTKICFDLNNQKQTAPDLVNRDLTETLQ